MSFIDDTFLPVAIELIDSVFPTKIRYFRNTGQVMTRQLVRSRLIRLSMKSARVC